MFGRRPGRGGHFVSLALAAALVLPSVRGEALSVGEPLDRAAAKYGLTEKDIAAIRAAGGELSCPGDGRNGATLNAWLVNSRQQILTNAHGIIDAADGLRLRQPLQRCTFTSFIDLGRPDKAARTYGLRFGDYRRLFRDGAPAPVDPHEDFGGDVARFRLDRPVEDGRALSFDSSPVAVGDELLLVSRVPIGRQSRTTAGDLLIQRCTVKSLDPPSPIFSQGAISGCYAVVGMSAGILIRQSKDRLVAKGLLVSVKYEDGDDNRAGRLLGAHHLTIDKRFQSWLGSGCPFWPKALMVRACGH